MAYIELMRLRKALLIYAAVVVAVFLLILIPSHWPGAVIHTDSAVSIPLSVLLPIVGFCAIIFATAIGTSLNRENDGVEMVWTKPVSRERLALTYIGLDLAAIVLAYVLAFALALIILASFGLLKFIHADAAWFPILMVTLGVAFMWYGLLQSLTSWQAGGRGGIIIGLSWAACAFLLPALTAATIRSPGLHQFILVLNFLNPLAYISASGSSHVHVGVSVGGPTPIPHDVWARVAITWGFSLLGSLAAIVGWKRLEV